MIVPVLSIAGYVAGVGAQGVLVQDNTISGKADYGILVSDLASDNIIRKNDLGSFTAVVYGLRGASQMAVGPACRNNIIRNNIIGSLGEGATAGIKCFGDDNDFIRNDYTQSSIPGLTAGNVPCLLLGYWYDSETGEIVDEPKGNLIFEVDLPSGTNVADQVLDDPMTNTGITTNTIVGI